MILMTMQITTMVLMTTMNAYSPDPGGHSHTDLCFTLLKIFTAILGWLIR